LGREVWSTYVVFDATSTPLITGIVRGASLARSSPAKDARDAATNARKPSGTIVRASWAEGHEVMTPGTDDLYLFPDPDQKLVDQAGSLGARVQMILTVRLKDALEKQTAMMEGPAKAQEKQAFASDALGRRVWWLNVWLLVVAVVGLVLSAVPVLNAFKIVGPR
jgi:hypothetical protein